MREEHKRQHVHTNIMYTHNRIFTFFFFSITVYCSLDIHITDSHSIVRKSNLNGGKVIHSQSQWKTIHRSLSMHGWAGGGNGYACAVPSMATLDKLLKNFC